MTPTQVKQVLQKVELLEAQALFLYREAGEIRKLLDGIIDPDNKKAQARAKKLQSKFIVSRAVMKRNKFLMDQGNKVKGK